MAASPAVTKSPEITEAICKRISLGESLRAVCRDDSMPSVVSVWRWLNEDEDFRKQYARAREEQADYLAEECLELADKADPETANVARLQVDTRKWFIGKTCKGKWGDKPSETHFTAVTSNNLLVVDQGRLIELQERHKAQLKEIQG